MTLEAPTLRDSGTRTKKARFEVRMPEDLKDQLKRAAEATGVSATDVALRAIAEYSQRELERHEVTRLTHSEAVRFAAALNEAPQVNSRLLKAIKRRRELIRN